MFAISVARKISAHYTGALNNWGLAGAIKKCHQTKM
jgi:hypothetical protein